MQEEHGCSVGPCLVLQLPQTGSVQEGPARLKSPNVILLWIGDCYYSPWARATLVVNG